MKTETSDKLDTKSTERPTYKTGLRVAMYAAKLNERVEELEKENAVLKAALDAQMKYQKELRTDRDRLDWLERNGDWFRSMIDEAMEVNP